MKLFETERLIIKKIEQEDKAHFAELFTDLNVLELIPQKPFTTEQITERFTKSLNLKHNDLNNQKCAFGVYQKGNSELIGLALFLISEKNEKELGYRFRAKHWGNGYGTETTKGMLTYYFNVLKVEKVVTDVNIANKSSVKILDKFMTLVKEFFNQRDNCTDRQYVVNKSQWLQQDK